MPVYFVQGKLGSGKTLAGIHRIQEALNQGRRVATNIDLNLEHLVNPWAKKTFVLRMPDKPSGFDFDALPLGYDGDYKSEDFNGDLHLDECAIWFNSRNWNDKGRASIIEWIVHARKKRWNIYFYVQDIDVVDKQARDMFAEHLVTCKRTDRFNIPFIGWIINPIMKTAVGKKLPLPKYHLATVQYGTSQFSPIVDRWWYKGQKLYAAYDTEQQFYPPEHPDAVGLHSVLPPWYVYGRYFSRMEHLKNAFRDFKVTRLHFFSIGAGIAYLLTNFAVTAMPEVPKKGFMGCNDAYKALYGSCDAYPVEKTQSASTSPSQSKKPEPIKSEPFKEIYVTGSVMSGKGQHYTFKLDGKPFDAYSSGYTVESVDWCTAIIERGNLRQVVYCNPTFDTDSPQQQIASAATPANPVNVVATIPESITNLVNQGLLCPHFGVI